MTDTFTCPRRIEDGRAFADSPMRGSGPNLDTWDVREYPEHPGILNNRRRSCSYCGSLHPDDFMQAIDDGAEIGPTDKTYKAYIEWDGVDNRHGKFYFQHLTAEQRSAFVAALNTGTIRIGFPGHFYVTPFFISYAPAEERHG